MKKVLLWETSAAVAGGQKMTLTVMDLLKEDYEFHCLIPRQGPLSAELEKRNIPYTLMGDQSMPAGVKGKKVYFQYAWLSLKNIVGSLRAIRRFRPDLLYAPGPASLPWSALCGTLTGKPVVWHLHHLFSDGPTKKLLNFTCRWKSVRGIVAISKSVGDQITHPEGREKGILSGANVVMPNLSPQNVRSKYLLYDGKLAAGAEAAENLADLKKRMEKIGYRVVEKR